MYAAELGRATAGGGAETLAWMVVNRNGGAEGDRSGDILRVPCVAGARFYDIYHGRELDEAACVGNVATIRLRVEALGFGAVLRCPPGDVDVCRPAAAYMERMRELTRRELRDYGPAAGDWRHLPQAILPNPTTPIPTTAPPGMVLLPAGDLEFDATYGGRPSPGITYSGDVQFPWEPSPRTRHTQLLAMHPLYMGETPVTNGEYARYLMSAPARGGQAPLAFLGVFL